MDKLIFVSRYPNTRKQNMITANKCSYKDRYPKNKLKWHAPIDVVLDRK